MRTLLASLIGSSLLSVVGACGADAPPSPAEVRAHISANLPRILAQSQTAFAAVTPADATPAPARAALAIALARVPLLADAFQALPSAKLRPTTGAGADASFDPHALERQLDDKLFTDANEVEPGVYAITPAFACADGDTACAQDLPHDLRVRVERDGDAMHFFLQADAQHDEPIELALSKSTIDVTVDLDRAAGVLAASLAADPSAPAIHARGEIHAQLVANLVSPQVSAAVDFTRDLAIDAGPLHLASPAAHVLAIDVQPDAKLAHAALGLGDTTLAFASSDPSGAPTTDAFELPQLTASIQVHEGVLLVQGLSLGDRPTTFTRDGHLAMSLALNPHGVAAAGVFKADATGTTLDALAPFDLQITRDHAVLADDAPLYDVTRVRLDATTADGGRVWIAPTGDLLRAEVPLSIVTDPAAFSLELPRLGCAVADPDDGHWVAAACPAGTPL